MSGHPEESTSGRGDRPLGSLRRQSDPPGVSLDDLSSALAEMLEEGQDPYEHAPLAQSESADPLAQDDAYEACAVTPKSILEAMLFVGRPDDRPLESNEVAALMRGVRPAEIDDLVRELNEQYVAAGRPYRIESVDSGYRLELSSQFVRLRDRFLGRMRRARLSQAAVDVLAIVAYHQPLGSDEVTKLRGTPSGSILSQLVRRRLLAVERLKNQTRRFQYRTTPRFLELFGLKSLDDLPRQQDVERR
jgi:segregation and condensation protein B